MRIFRLRFFGNVDDGTPNFYRIDSIEREFLNINTRKNR
jgi:hypothetical protein